MRDKKDLIRVVKSADGTVSADPVGKKNGRGAYVCRNADCIEKCRKSKALSRAFGCPIDDALYTELARECENDKR